MEWGVKEDDFFDLCEQYLQLVEARARVVGQDGGLGDNLVDELLADQIDDFDVRQRILMCRILFSGEQTQPLVADERAEEFPVVEQVRAGDEVCVDSRDDTPVAVDAPVAVAERESGGTARGRFALRELAGMLKAPFGRGNSRFG